MATRAFMVKRVGLHVVALGEHAHDGVLQFLGVLVGVLDVVLHVPVVPEGIDEPAVIGVRAEGATLEAKVALAETEDAVVGRGGARGRLGFGIGPESRFALGYRVAVVHRLGVAVGECPEVGIRSFGDHKAVNSHRGFAVSLASNRDEVSTGLRERQGKVGRLSDLARAR